MVVGPPSLKIWVPRTGGKETLSCTGAPKPEFPAKIYNPKGPLGPKYILLSTWTLRASLINYPKICDPKPSALNSKP